MKLKKMTSIIITYVFLVSTILQAMPVTSVKAEETKTQKQLKAVDGEIVFKLKDSKYLGYEELLKKYKAGIVNKSGEHLLIRVNKEDTSKVIGELRSDSNIQYAEVNASAKKQGTTNDPELSTENFLFYSHVIEAWDYLKNVSTAEIRVAVVDSGVKADHPDLAGKILAGYNFLTNSTNSGDDNGHGTQVAGVIAANPNNGIGIAGVTGTINAKILPVKVMDAQGNCTSYNVAQGIRYAADNGASIINLSLAGQGYSEEVNDAVKYAKSKNIIVVAAAGDFGDYTSNYWPANSEGALVVSDYLNAQLHMSNYGKEISLSAFGFGTTTDINNKYVDASGSSIATAVVSGVAALTKAKNPGYSYGQIESILKKSANPYEFGGYNHYTGYGLVDALKMTSTVSNYIEMVSPISGENVVSEITSLGATKVSVKVKALNPSDLSKIEVYANDSSILASAVGNGTADYTLTVDSSILKDGYNKLTVKAYSKTNSTVYEDFRYIKTYSKSKNYVKLNLLGSDGVTKIKKGTKVYLIRDGNMYGALSQMADENGSVTFFNINPNYSYEVFYIDDYGTGTIKVPAIFRKKIDSTGTITLSAKSLSQRPVTINALNKDGKALLNSKLNLIFDGYRFDFDNVFDPNGKGTIYITDDLGVGIQVVNDAEGYMYRKSINGFAGVNSINFSIDSSMANIKITNDLDTKLAEGILTIKDRQDFNFYNPVSFGVKNKSVYVPKGEYYWNYEAVAKDAENNKWVYGYEPIVKSISGNSEYKYGAFSLKLNQDTSPVIPGSEYSFGTVIADAYSNKINSDSELGYRLYENMFNNISLKDSKGNNAISNIVMSSMLNEDGYHYGVAFNPSAPTDYYSISGSADLGPLGVINSNVLNINHTNGGNSNKAMITVKSTTSSKLIDARYVIYNKSDNSIVSQGDAKIDYNSGQALIEVDKTCIGSNNKILVTATSTLNENFVYNRQLTDGIYSYTIDNSAGQCKRLYIQLDDSSKNSLLKNTYIQIPTAVYEKVYINGEDILADGSTNYWLENGDYSFSAQDYTDKYIFGGTFSISSTNSKMIIGTKDLAKFSANITNIIGIQSCNVLLTKGSNNYYGYDMELKNNEVLYVSPSLNLNVANLSVISFDYMSGNRYRYNFSGNYPLIAGTVKNISINDFTISNILYNSNIDLPCPAYISYKISSGDLTLINVESESNYAFNNSYEDKHEPLYFNLYDSNGVLASSTLNVNKGYCMPSFIDFEDYSLKAGNYSGKVIIPGIANQPSNYSMNLNFTTDNLQKVKIMNPFDISRPLAYSDVTANGQYSKTDEQGYLYLRKGDISVSSDIVINASADNSLAVYSPDSISSSTDFTVSKAITSLKKVAIKAKNNFQGKASLSNSFISLSSSNGKIISFDLDVKGEKILYLDADNYTGANTGEVDMNTTFMIPVNFNTASSSEYIIDNCNLGTIQPEKGVDIVVNNNYNVSLYGRSLMVPVGSYVHYNGNDNGVTFEGSFKVYSTSVYPIGPNIDAGTQMGDINKDNIIDIYDLVIISKKVGMNSVIDNEWDDRVNIDNSDNAKKIDIKDLAKAAQNYSKKY